MCTATVCVVCGHLRLRVCCGLNDQVHLALVVEREKGFSIWTHERVDPEVFSTYLRPTGCCTSKYVYLLNQILMLPNWCWRTSDKKLARVEGDNKNRITGFDELAQIYQQPQISFSTASQTAGLELPLDCRSAYSWKKFSDRHEPHSLPDYLWTIRETNRQVQNQLKLSGEAKWLTCCLTYKLNTCIGAFKSFLHSHFIRFPVHTSYNNNNFAPGLCTYCQIVRSTVFCFCLCDWITWITSVMLVQWHNCQ